MTMTEQRTGAIAELHDRLVAEIRGSNNRDHRKLANNTYGRIELNEVVVIKLHDTDIAHIGHIAARYRTGGWFTVTTKERINRYLPWRWHLHSEKSVWYLTELRDDGHHEKHSRFYDEILLRDQAGGVVVDEPKLDDPDAGMRHRINQYVKLYTDERIDWLVKTAQAQGINGDCFFCQFTGDTGTDHLEQHMVQRYTMVSLMLNALTEAGYRDPGFVLSVGLGDPIRRAIRKYMLKRLTHRR